jgi:hypothetical protein
MRRWPTWLVVGALLALAAVAVADAIRPTGGPTSVSLQAPRASGLQGTLVVAGPDCSVSALRLPALVEEEPPKQPNCGEVVWSADGTISARCARDMTIVGPTPDGLLFRLRGCAPALRPNGDVSVIRDGNLVVAPRHGAPRVYISRDAVASQVSKQLPNSESYELAEVQWLDQSTFAAILSGRQPWQRAVAVFGQGALETVVPEFGQRISSLTASPHGNLGFAHSQLGREFVMLTRNGREVPLPRIANARAIAWSPDERWVALMTRTTTFIARTGTRQVVRQIPVGGDSLDWTP